PAGSAARSRSVMHTRNVLHPCSACLFLWSQNPEKVTMHADLGSMWRYRCELCPVTAATVRQRGVIHSGGGPEPQRACRFGGVCQPSPGGECPPQLSRLGTGGINSAKGEDAHDTRPTALAQRPGST